MLLAINLNYVAVSELPESKDYALEICVSPLPNIWPQNRVTASQKKAMF